MTPQRKKLGRVLKTAASSATRLKPLRIRVHKHTSFAPLAGETPFVILRVQIVAGKDILSKDKNGASDPFVVASLGRHRHQTTTVKRTTNPTWDPKEATFDFPIYRSLAGVLGTLELVLWFKDKFRKDYLGEVSLLMEDWFKDGQPISFTDPKNEPSWFPIVSTRPSTHPTGSLLAKLGFVMPHNGTSSVDYETLYGELLEASGFAVKSLHSAAPTIGIGTIRSGRGGPAFVDDGLSSEGEGDSEIEEHEAIDPSLTPETLTAVSTTYSDTLLEPLPPPMLVPPSPIEPQLEPQLKPSKPSAKALSAALLPKFTRRTTSTSIQTQTDTTFSSEPPRSPVSPIEPSHKGKKLKFRTSWSAKKIEYNLSASNDIIGIVMLEINSAEDLPKLKNMTRLGWDMDPFVVISFGKKVFRTRVIRHSLNPTWDEKLLFHVRRYETNFKVNFKILDWDKLSGNDQICSTTLDVSELLDKVPKPDPTTGLYPTVSELDHDMLEYTLPLIPVKEVQWETKHQPKISFRAKYQPYGAVRQRFWREYLSQYATDDLLSHLEISSMLDSLGSTLSRETVDTFLTRHGQPIDGELSIDQAIICLEQELCRPTSEKKPVNKEHISRLDSSAPTTPAPTTNLSSPPMLEQLDFAGPDLYQLSLLDPFNADTLQPPRPLPTEPAQRPLQDVASQTSSTSDILYLERKFESTPPPSAPEVLIRESSASSSDAEDSGQNSDDTVVERVINIKTCPLCHRPRLKSKAEADIVTHIALCASRDWRRVDRIMVGNFVTASQAQRKWYTKVIAKVSSGAYQLGANSANIIVQNRMTGQLEEEKMQVYVRLGIRLLYKGAKSRMEGARARRLLKSMSIKQGLKYDSPESAREILAFIEFHKLNVAEIRDPLTSFKTFNEFFYRKLKEDARPIDSPDDPTILVSGADCRMLAFDTVNDATQIWIKGREFTVARLLGDRYKDQAAKYSHGSLAIFRLAPQDYHRFHSPVDGIVGPMTYISGEYYTVNPQAIRTTLDVFGENARKIVPIDSPVFGRVFAVCVGAMMVGSIITTVEEGRQVQRGQELGYFAFGGSTIVLLFEKNTVQWDEDLVINSRASLETLVRVGMHIGKARIPTPKIDGDPFTYNVCLIHRLASLRGFPIMHRLTSCRTLVRNGKNAVKPASYVLSRNTHSQTTEGYIHLNWFENAFLATGSMLASFYNPRRGDMISALGETTAGPALPRLRDTMIKSEEGRRILKERPRLTSETINMEELKKLPDGSFGRAYITWLERNGVTPDTREPVLYIPDPELAYVMQRYRECHDFYHCICSMPVTVSSELALKYFEFANFGLPVAAISALFGPFMLTSQQRTKLFRDYVPWALKCGASARCLIDVYWEKRWAMNVDEMRKEFGIWNPPPAVWPKKPFKEAEREKERVAKLKVMQSNAAAKEDVKT